MTTLLKNLDSCDYYGKFFIMYSIGKNIPSIIDRTLSICDKKLRWAKANITNKLPIYLIPIETKYDEIYNSIFKEITEQSVTNTYYLATIHKNKVYVIDKSFNNYLLVHYSEKTINSQFLIPPDQETFTLLPNSNIYMVGNPTEIVNGESDFSSYKGSIYFSTSAPVDTSEEVQQQQRIQTFSNDDVLTGVFKNNKEEKIKENKISKETTEESNMMFLYIFLIIIFIIVIIGLVIYFVNKE